MHILPAGFMKIRHYGILSGTNKKIALQTARAYLGAEPPKSIRGLSWQELFIILFGREHDSCPKCKTGKMVPVYAYLPKSKTRAPPAQALPKVFEKVYQK